MTVDAPEPRQVAERDLRDEPQALHYEPRPLRGAELLALLAAERETLRQQWPLVPERRSAHFSEPAPAHFTRRRNALQMALGIARTPLRASLLACFFYVFVFSFSVVRGSSMSPGIHDGDRILIDQISHYLTGIERGDIVVLRYPLDPRLDYIKRVVGLPGDEIVMAGGALWVDGELCEEPYVGESDVTSWTFTRVRDGHVFVLGDNRSHSSDSREFGQVPLDHLRGRVDLRVWPPARFGWLR